MPELGVGLLVAVVFGVVGMMWHLSSVNKAEAVAAAHTLQRGETIEAGDLELVHVPRDGQVSFLDPSQIDRIIGHTAAVDLPAGTLLGTELVTEARALGPDDGLVGLSLEPGQFPAYDLAPGDVVKVYALGASGAALAEGEVFSIRDVIGGDRKLVSIRAPESSAAAVASSDPNALRLVVVTP